MAIKVKFRQLISSQFFAFLIFLAIFLVAAGFGWEKLHHDGLFTADEGWHMTEGWRLAAGDRLFQDTNEAIRLYYVLNAVIFKIHPEITLLGFRKLQYIFTMFALLIFSVALYKSTKKYWFLPLIFWSFAVTGLLPWGIYPNLNYYTYSHFFLVVHLSFLLLGLHHKHPLIKRFFYVLSGLAIWGTSFSLLHTSVIIFSPVILFFLCRKSSLKSFSFTFSDLCFVMAPVFILWAIFIAIYRETYIFALIASIKFELSNSMYSRYQSAIEYRDLLILKSLGITSLYVVFSYWALTKLRPLLSILSLSIFSFIMWFLIQKVFSPLDILYLGIPTCFASFFLVSLIILWFKIIKGCFTTLDLNDNKELSIILLIPATILALIMSVFSFNKVWMVMQASIPISAAISIYILFHTKNAKMSYLIKGLGLMLFFLPFYYSISWYSFDCMPQKSFPHPNINVEIKDGFGKGIKTDQVYSDLYEWIRENTETYSGADDFIISMVEAPIVYSVAKRRPSLATSWVTFCINYPSDLYAEELKIMEKNDRQPRLAFVFKGIFGRFPFPTINPVSSYIKENMVPLNAFRVGGKIGALCYINRKAAVHISAKL